MRSIKAIFSIGLLLSCFLFLSYPSASAETITVAGTGDSQYLLRQLAIEFKKSHPDAKIHVPDSVGSGGGIKLLLANRTELARIARPLKPKEQAEGLQARFFAYSPLVFVANLPSACVQSISAKQFIGMLQGKISDWNQLGECPGHKIYIANREEGDSAKTVLEKHIPEILEIKNPAGKTIYSTPETYDTLNHYKYSFGYLPKAQIRSSILTVLDYEGVSASTENVQEGRYPLVVPLGIAWRDEPSGLTKQFIDYLFSPEARKLMEELNAVPVKL